MISATSRSFCPSWNQWLLILGSCAAVCVFSSMFLVQAYKNGHNFGYVMVRSSSADPSEIHNLRVTAVSPWSTSKPMILGRNGIWEIPENDTLAVNEIHVQGGEETPIPEFGWEVSISSDSEPLWVPATVVFEAHPHTLKISPDLIPGSWVKNYAKTWNWLGDWYLLGTSIIKSVLVTGAIYFIALLGWKIYAHFKEVLRIPAASAEIVHRLPDSILTRSDRVVLWALILCAVAFGTHGFWWISTTLWPGINDDGALFTTVILNRAAGNGNQFAVYTSTMLLRGGDTDLNLHGQLYHAAISGILPKANYESLLGCLNQINLLTFFLVMIVIALSVRNIFRTSWLAGFLVSVPAAYATVAVMHHIQGRPEHGIPPILTAFALVREMSRSRSLPHWLQGAQIGIVAAISPLSGALLGFATVFSQGLRESSCRVYGFTTLIQLICSCASWAVFTSMSYDGSLADLMINTANFGPGLYNGWKPAEWDNFWMHLKLAPGLGLLFVPVFLCAAVAFVCAWFGRTPLASKILLSISAIPLAWLTWTNGVAWAGWNYTFIGFLPSLVLWLLEIISVNYTRHFAKNPPISRMLPFAALLCVALVLANIGRGPIRVICMQKDIWHRGVRYSAARARVKELSETLSSNEVIMFDAYYNARSAVVLGGIPWKMQTRPGDKSGTIENAEKRLGFFARYYLVLQYGNAPPERAGFHLVEDTFTPLPIYFAGQELEYFTPGYAYAIYERD